jgi:hypothetical protein
MSDYYRPSLRKDKISITLELRINTDGEDHGSVFEYANVFYDSLVETKATVISELFNNETYDIIHERLAELIQCYLVGASKNG